MSNDDKGTPTGKARNAAVAGRFYPGEGPTLRSMVERLLAEVPDASTTAIKGGGGDTPLDPSKAVGYVVPHAGYRYSGPIAARAYARLRAQAATVRRIVLVGPSHFVRLMGCAVPTTEVWRTPLGEVAVDVAACRALVDAGAAAFDDAPHAREHSLEVQLPFLQVTVPDVVVVPVAVGITGPGTVATLLSALEAPGTVVLCSTDLSHYHDQATAQRLDRRTASAVMRLDASAIGIRDACGVFALRGTVEWARQRGWRPELLDLRTSADTMGDPTRVVGYPAFAFHPTA